MRNQAPRLEAPGHTGGWRGQAARTLRTQAFAGAAAPVPEAPPGSLRARVDPAGTRGTEGDQMHGSIQPARLTRSRRAHLPAAALLLSGVLVAGCTGSSGHPATTAATRSAPSSANSSCLLPPVSSCYPPRQLRVAYGIQPLLDSGIDGRGETVTVLAPPPAANEPGGRRPATPPPVRAGDHRYPPGSGGVRPDVRVARRADPGCDHPGRRSLALAGVRRGGPGPRGGARGRPRRHRPRGPAARRRPGQRCDRDRLAGLRLAVSGTDVASIGWSLGNTFSPRLRWPRCIPYCGGGRSARHGGRQLRRQPETLTSAPARFCTPGDLR